MSVATVPPRLGCRRRTFAAASIGRASGDHGNAPTTFEEVTLTSWERSHRREIRRELRQRCSRLRNTELNRAAGHGLRFYLWLPRARQIMIQRMCNYAYGSAAGVSSA